MSEHDELRTPPGATHPTALATLARRLDPAERTRAATDRGALGTALAVAAIVLGLVLMLALAALAWQLSGRLLDAGPAALGYPVRALALAYGVVTVVAVAAIVVRLASVALGRR